MFLRIQWRTLYPLKCFKYTHHASAIILCCAILFCALLSIASYTMSPLTSPSDSPHYSSWIPTPLPIYPPIRHLSLFLSLLLSPLISPSHRFYLSIYVAINIGIAIFSLSRELYARLRSWSAGQVLFREMLAAVLYAPMSFFDTTPLGRIVNRFSKVSLSSHIHYTCC